MCEFPFPMSLADTYRFRPGMALGRARLGKPTTAPVAFVSVKGINKHEFATVMFVFEMVQRP
jgi:hypothetical protein